jgi:chromosomal replication initiation ATPase DnaA
MTYALSPEAIAACNQVFIQHRCTVLKIVDAVSEAAGIPARHILSQKRTAAVARARQIVMYEARQAGLSYPQIGMVLGRDHTSVMHGVKREAERRNPQP